MAQSFDEVAHAYASEKENQARLMAEIKAEYEGLKSLSIPTASTN